MCDSGGMTSLMRRSRQNFGPSIALALRALRTWTARQVVVAIVVGLAVAVLIGVATVLIPNPIFARDIPPVWWNYPVWLVTSALSGMLVATYVRGEPGAPEGKPQPEEAGAEAAGGTSDVDGNDQRTTRMGMAGGVLAWFAVGCPVCNKLALLALGYSGAITWFTPLQPFLAIGALVLTGVAVVGRLRGQVACPVSPMAAV